MKYFYQKPEKAKPLYGRAIVLEHPAYKRGTLFEQNGKGMIITQLRLTDKYAHWDAIDFWLANDIYLHPNFKKWFKENATEKDYPIFQVRSVMWALRMKPLPKQEWESYF